MHALLMAKLVGASGHVYAFEPDPGLFLSRGEHMEINVFNQVKCFQAGVWVHSGRAQFFSGHHLGAGYCTEVAETSGCGAEIEVVSLDDFVFGKKHHPPNFIKMDVEGAESKVLSG